MKYTVRKSQIYVLGKLWMPMCNAATTINLSDYDIQNARDDDGKITRDSLEQWLTTHSGDFSSVTDFSASIEDGDSTVNIPWSSEENEMAYLDCTSSDDD